MTKGYMGKVLWIDLSSGEFKDEEISEDVYREYLGGYGLAAKFIYENMPAKTDPLAPEAILGIFPGLLTGTVAPLSGRFMVAGKSPLTGTWGDANSGGTFGPEIKKCGYDGILIKGKAESPKYVTIIDGETKLLDASDIWGVDTIDIEERIAEKHGKTHIASIGLAGEKLSLISGIVCDKGRIAARSGLGAVMGSKMLKALVLRGNTKVPLSDKDLLMEKVKEYNNGINSATAGSIYMWKNIGTSSLTAIQAQTGDSPIKNWGGTTAEDFPMDRVKKIDGLEINKYKQKDYGCFACPVQCGAIMKVPEANLEETHLPEYETICSFGDMLLNDDIISLFTVNDLCNRAGIDTISTGGTIAFAIECFENGILGLDDTDGLKLNWGNSEAIIELVKKIINREGIGDILADGSRVASDKIGKGSEEYAINSRGQELPMHSPKFYKSLGMTYAFDPTPGRHTAATLDLMVTGSFLKPNGFIEGLALPRRFKRKGEDRWTAMKIAACIKQSTNCLGLCEFTFFFQKYPLLECIKAVVGWDMNVDEILKAGQRIQTLRQAFTLREGIEIIKNELPPRAVGIDYKEEYQGYCEKMGWNPENGHPLEETLAELNLSFAKDLN